MGLTVSYFRPNVNQNMQAGKGDLNEDNLGALAKGIGAYNKYNYRMKAADLMEGKGKAQDRINEIDAEIAELENKLNEYEQARQQDAQRVQASQAASQQMEGYRPNVGAQPPTSNEQTNSIYADQYLAQQAAMANQPNRSYGPTVANRMAQIDAAKQMEGYRPNTMSNYRWRR